jgi:hypothetical protein
MHIHTCAFLKTIELHKKQYFFLKQMTSGNSDWCLHKMLFYHSMQVIKKQNKNDDGGGGGGGHGDEGNDDKDI